MSNQIDEALKSPYKKMKDMDREVEFLSTDELLRRKRLANKSRPLFKTVTIQRTRGL